MVEGARRGGHAPGGNADMTAAGGVVTRQTHRKVLYEEQAGYPDNFTGEWFLNEMQKNVNFVTYDLWTVMQESLVVSQALGSVCAFAAVFLLLRDGQLDPRLLLSVCAAGQVAGCSLHISSRALSARPTAASKTRCKTGGGGGGSEGWGESESSGGSDAASWLGGVSLLEAGKSTFLVCALLLGLSPVLGSLTDTISTDTVYAMSIALLFLHLSLYDYSGGTSTVQGRDVAALNCALFGAVCVASRLPSTTDVFAFMAFSLQSFAAFPDLRRATKRRSMNAFVVLSLTAIAATLLLLQQVSGIGCAAYGLAVAFISLVCPVWLVHSQQYKDEIQGPWDEAVPSPQ